MRRTSVTMLVVFVVVAGLSTPAGALAGDLDTTFSSDGIKFAAGIQLNDVAIQPDGKVVAIGWTWGGIGYPRPMALRYTVDGDLDPTFSGDGRAPLRIGEAWALALRADGRIIVAGATVSREGLEQVAVERLTANGRRDLSFSGDGWVTRVVPQPWRGTSISPRGLAVDPAGRITVLIASYERPGDIDRNVSLLFRWGPDGGRTTTFGADGVAWARRCDEPGGLALQADGRSVVAGVGADEPIVGDAAGEPCITRLNANGTLNGAFGDHGVVTLGPEAGTAQGVRISPTNGTITAVFYGWDHVVSVARILPSGSSDTSFGDGGTVTGRMRGIEPMDMALQGNEVILAGQVETRSLAPSWAVARLTATGSFDATFGLRGIASVDGLRDDIATAVEVRRGAVVTAGWTSDGYSHTGGAVVRFLG